MQLLIKKRIDGAFRKILSAVIRLAIRNSLNYTQFAGLCKSLYVDIAANEYGLDGRRTNDSRIALITGLDRRDIKRMREATDEKIYSSGQSPDKMARILTQWYEAGEYVQADGVPLVLDIEGPAPSFYALIQAHGGDIAPVTVLREFKRSQVVEETAEGKLRVCKRYYIPNYHSGADKTPEFVDPAAIEHGSSMLSDHINTVFHNLYREDMGAPERLELRATNALVNRSQVPSFYKYINERGMQFLVEVDKWLAEHQVDAASVQDTERLGLGMYLIEGANSTLEEKNNV
ncbi:MAG: hypothetical protein KTR20_14240 [Cellvibrionaceae bacterium]|nr:hypothetical protein [Cellvibrionaceae bacterium]